jgi:hypothetical protein
MKKAYDDGRTSKDPVSFWFHGEIGFFDNWIIPLAIRLKDCGAFGSECYDYAPDNRREWEKKGNDEVALMLAKYNMWKTSQCDEGADDTNKDETLQCDEGADDPNKVEI